MNSNTTGRNGMRCSRCKYDSDASTKSKNQEHMEQRRATQKNQVEIITLRFQSLNGGSGGEAYK
jgi:tRNA(Ile2) C34 agmatinyltransferase TiaS